MRQKRGNRERNQREGEFEKPVNLQGAVHSVGDPASESAAQGETEKEACHRDADGDGRASQHELQLLEPEHLKDQGCRARCQEDRGDQNPVLQACGVSNTLTIVHRIALPMTGRTGKANAINIALWSGDASRRTGIYLNENTWSFRQGLTSRRSSFRRRARFFLITMRKPSGGIKMLTKSRAAGTVTC